MQVTFNINEKVYDELKNKALKDGLSLEQELEQLILLDKRQDFYEWAKETDWKAKGNDVSLNHDNYLYGENESDE